MTFFDLFDKLAGVCQKLCYIALCVILLMTLFASAADADVGDDFIMMGGDNQLMGAEVIIPGPPAGVIVETQTDEVSGMTKVTVYIRTFFKDVQSKYHELVDTSEATDETEAPKAS